MPQDQDSFLDRICAVPFRFRGALACLLLLTAWAVAGNVLSQSGKEGAFWEHVPYVSFLVPTAAGLGIACVLIAETALFFIFTLLQERGAHIPNVLRGALHALPPAVLALSLLIAGNAAPAGMAMLSLLALCLLSPAAVPLIAPGDRGRLGALVFFSGRMLIAAVTALLLCFAFEALASSMVFVVSEELLKRRITWADPYDAFIFNLPACVLFDFLFLAGFPRAGRTGARGTSEGTSVSASQGPETCGQ